MPTPMSYAQALNEAKKVIVQQSHRIKSEIDTVRTQQQVMAEQKAAITDREKRLEEDAAALQKQTDEMRELDAKLKAEQNAREQAEAIVDRQGERVTNMQAQAAELEKRLAEQAEIIARLAQEREELAARVPSDDDDKALAELTSLLTTKRIPASVARECLKSGKAGSISPSPAEQPVAEAA